MNNLTQQLIEKTQNLKAAYIAKTEEFAASYFETMQTRNALTHEQWKETFGGNEFGLSKSAYAKREEARKVIRMGLEAFVAKELANAEKHYVSSIKKLGDKISEKGLNMELLSVLDGTVGVNFETTITDGIVTVKAFTILAHGPIVRPHYRYLVK